MPFVRLQLGVCRYIISRAQSVLSVVALLNGAVLLAALPYLMGLGYQVSYLEVPVTETRRLSEDLNIKNETLPALVAAHA